MPRAAKLAAHDALRLAFRTADTLSRRRKHAAELCVRVDHRADIRAGFKDIAVQALFARGLSLLAIGKGR